jgi:hypothetical protein
MEPTEQDDAVVNEIFAYLGIKTLDTEGLVKMRDALLSKRQTPTIVKPFQSNHEVGEAMGNLDDTSPDLLGKNTENNETTRKCQLTCLQLKRHGVGDFLGDLVIEHQTMMISNNRKGRTEKVQMVTGNKTLTTAKPVFEIMNRKKEEPSETNQGTGTEKKG